MATNDYDCPLLIFTGSLEHPAAVTDEFDPVFIKYVCHSMDAERMSFSGWEPIYTK